MSNTSAPSAVGPTALEKIYEIEVDQVGIAPIERAVDRAFARAGFVPQKASPAP